MNKEYHIFHSGNKVDSLDIIQLVRFLSMKPPLTDGPATHFSNQ